MGGEGISEILSQRFQFYAYNRNLSGRGSNVLREYFCSGEGRGRGKFERVFNHAQKIRKSAANSRFSRLLSTRTLSKNA